MSIKSYYKPSLLLKPEMEKPLKQIALNRGVRVQDLIRDAVLDLIREDSQSGIPIAIEKGAGFRAESRSLSQLTQLRALLGEALALIDGVQSDGQCVADEIGEIERTLADSGHPGNPRQDAAPHGVRPKPGRRAQ